MPNEYIPYGQDVPGANLKFGEVAPGKQYIRDEPPKQPTPTTPAAPTGSIIIPPPSPQQAQQIIDAVNRGDTNTLRMAAEQGRISAVDMARLSQAGQGPDNTRQLIQAGILTETPDHVVIPTSALDRMGERYKRVAKEQGYDAMLTLFKSENAQLPDGNFIPVRELAQLPGNYRQIAQKHGYDTLVRTINKDVTDFKEHNVKLGDGSWMPKEQLDELPSKYQKVAISQGFEAVVQALRDDGYKVNEDKPNVKTNEKTTGSLSGESKPDIVWKPDYTKKDPYEGAPKDYVERVKSSFAPSSERPLPPFAGRVVDPIRSIVLDETGKDVTIKEYRDKILDTNKLNPVPVPVLSESLTRMQTNVNDKINEALRQFGMKVKQYLFPSKSGKSGLAMQTPFVSEKIGDLDGKLTDASRNAYRKIVDDIRAESRIEQQDAKTIQTGLNSNVPFISAKIAQLEDKAKDITRSGIDSAVVKIREYVRSLPESKDSGLASNVPYISSRIGEIDEKIDAIIKDSASDIANSIKTEYEKVRANIPNETRLSGVPIVSEKIADVESKAQAGVSSLVADMLSRLSRSDPKEQQRLKSIYEERQETDKLPFGERIKVRSMRMLDPEYATVIKLDDGTYSTVVGGYAPGVGVGGSPQNLINIIKAVTALGAGVATLKGVQAVKQAVDDYQAANKKEASVRDVVAIDTANQAAFTLGDYSKTGQLPEDDLKKINVESLPGYTANIKVPKLEGMTAGVQVARLEGFSRLQPEVIVLSDPGVRTNAEDYVLKSSAVADAGKKLTETVGKPGMDLDKILADAETQHGRDVLDSVKGTPAGYKALNESMKADVWAGDKEVNLPMQTQAMNQSLAMQRWRQELARVEAEGLRSAEISRVINSTPQIFHNRGLDAAYKDYLLKKAILANARRSYIASLDPTPIQGNMNQEALYILAGTQLAHYIKSDTSLSNSQKLQLLNELENELKNALKSEISAKAQELLQTKTKTSTKPQLKTKTATAVKAAEQTQTREAEQTRTAEATRPAEATRTAENTIPAEAARTAALTRTTDLTNSHFPPKPPKIKEGGGKREERLPSKQVKPGSVAWRQGSLEVDPSKPGAEDVYYYAEPPDYEVKTLVGKAPAGYKQKGRTPQETIQVIGGPAKRNLSVNMGVTTANVKAGSEKIEFTANPKAISQRTPPISQKPAVIGGYNIPRISPKTPRLR